ncbi:hypothetical protein M378DRAFT_90208, partial [Amanita muscaria Koide BX008]
MSHSTSLNDVYSNVEKLDANGSNWYMFQLRFLSAAEYKEVSGQFDGSNQMPGPPTPIGENVKELTAEQKKEYATSLATWKKKEGTARYLLWSSIPNSILVKINRKPTVAEMWEWIVVEFTEKSMSMQAHLHAEFMSMRYTKGADLRTEFD